MTTIRVSSELSKEIEEKKKIHGFKSKEETISFALSLLKTQDELIREDLEPLKKRLSSLKADNIYYEIEEKIDELLSDPFETLLRKKLLSHIRSGGNHITQSQFKSMCRDCGIPAIKWEDYALFFKIEWKV